MLMRNHYPSLAIALALTLGGIGDLCARRVE